MEDWIRYNVEIDFNTIPALRLLRNAYSDGTPTAKERRMLQHFQPSSSLSPPPPPPQWAAIQTALAIEASKMVSLFLGNIPIDVAKNILTFAIDVDTIIAINHFCVCKGEIDEEEEDDVDDSCKNKNNNNDDNDKSRTNVLDFSWLSDDYASSAARATVTATSETFSICSFCEKCKYVTVSPKILVPSATTTTAAAADKKEKKNNDFTSSAMKRPKLLTTNSTKSSTSSSLSLGTIRIRNNQSFWKPCRHFHIEKNSNSVPIVAVRHRLSGFHSFRTIVCNEWITRGTIEYSIVFKNLTYPYSCALGIVTPDAIVNHQTAWYPGGKHVPGTSNKTNTSWGLCMEGRYNENDNIGRNRNEERAVIRGTKTIEFGGNATNGSTSQGISVSTITTTTSKTNNSSNNNATPMTCNTAAINKTTTKISSIEEQQELLMLNEGDNEFKIVIDATNRTIVIEKSITTTDRECKINDLSLLCESTITTTTATTRWSLQLNGEEYQQQRQGSVLASSTFPPAEKNETYKAKNCAPPLALAVALKFAGDEAVLLPC